MALSNWDTLAFDKNGKPTNGIFQVGKITVEIYKNWLYIHDPKAWASGDHFCKDTVMQVTQGTIIYKPLTIVAKRGRQSSVLCIVWTCDYKKPKNKRYDIMIGCGVAGYRGNKWVGVENETFNELTTFAKKVISDEMYGENIVIFPTKPLRFNQGDAFFSKAFSADISATETGKPKKPILEQAMNDIKKGVNANG